MKLSLIVGFIVTVLFSGCAQWNSISNDFNVNNGVGKLIDVKQRAIIVVKKDTNTTVVCTEPSPDALSAYAMQMGLEGSVPNQGAVKLAIASQESSAYIGLRTQSIQLLRDAMYRNCEAYANGALNKEEYSIASRRYQRSMVALLAIEQLTGAVRVPPIIITTEGAAEVAKSISEMQSEADAIDKDITQLTKQIYDINTTGKTGDELSMLKEKKTSLENQKFSKERNQEAITKAIENARGVMTTGKTYATIHDKRTDYYHNQNVGNVADTVYKIFENLNDADDFAQLCGSYLIPGHIADHNSSIADICKNRLQQMTDTYTIDINNNKKSVDTLVTIILDKKNSEEIRKRAMEILFSSASESSGQTSTKSPAEQKKPSENQSVKTKAIKHKPSTLIMKGI